MKFDPDRCKRRSTRLKGWDYASPGYYFITICTYERERLFGDVVNGKMQLNDAGHFTEQCWKNIPKHFPYTDLDEFVIMPNHMHGIVVIRRSVGAYNHTPQRQDQSVPRGANIYSPMRINTPIEPSLRSPSKTIGSIIRGFKIGVSKMIKKNTEISMVWQRNYYEHIIRSEAELDQTRQYIRDTPAEWPDDEENLVNQVRRGV
jgi:putative transposase